MLVLYLLRAENIPTKKNAKKQIATYLTIESNINNDQRAESSVDSRFYKNKTSNKSNLIYGHTPTINQYLAYQVKNWETTVELKLFKKYDKTKMKKDRLLAKSTLMLNRIYSELVNQSEDQLWKNNSSVWVTKTLMFTPVQRETKKKVKSNSNLASMFVSPVHVYSRISFVEINQPLNRNEDTINDGDVAFELTDSRAIFEESALNQSSTTIVQQSTSEQSKVHSD